MGAAIAFYALFSFAPVLVIVTSVAGIAFGRRVAEQAVLQYLQGLVGATGTNAVRPLVAGTASIKMGAFVSLFGIFALFVGASGAFIELQDSLNQIWKVKRRTRGIWWMALKQRIVSLALVLSAGLLLMMPLLASSNYVWEAAIAQAWPALPHILHSGLLAAAADTLALALAYKFLPSAPVAWRHAWLGAAAGSLLFDAGKVFIRDYLLRSTVASAFGPAGSLVILLVWLYFGLQALLIGAELAHACAQPTQTRD